ncbi:hypothetical protein BsWGS_28603 [Bradybaena similaris]
MSLPDRLSISIREEPASVGCSDSSGNLMQKCVIIQRDERGYGFTVSGDNPVFVASVKQDGAAARAGVQNGDRIVKVNGTLVTQRNHLDVVKLIKAGSYVALTLLGKPSPSATSGGVVSNPSTLPYMRDSGIGRVTAPQPVDPDKDRELWQQKVHMTRAMFETAREDFEKLQKQYVSKPSEKLHSQLLDKEKTVKALENQLKQLTGGEEPVTVSPLLPSTTPDLGNLSDSSQTSPSVSPTPEDADSRHNGQDMEDLVGQQDIIPPDYEEDTSEDDQLLTASPRPGGRPDSSITTKTNDHGPFADMKLLENKPAHMSVFLNYLISNSDPSPVLFHIISDLYCRSPGNNKELRKWAYEIFSTFIFKMAPLSISVEDNIISQIDNILASSGSRADNENVLRGMFQAPRLFVQPEIADLLNDFRNRKDLGMGSLFGIQKIYDNMDRAAEVRVAEELLVPHLRTVGTEESSHGALVDRDLATAWALATYLRSLGGPKSVNYGMIERVQTFMMKDKKSLKFPGSRSSRAKALKGHQFNLQHFYVTTFCTFCGNLVWGVGYQGYICQNCEIVLHKTCAEEITEACCGKKKIRPRLPIPGVIQTRRQSSNLSDQQQQQQQQPQTDQVSQSTTPGRSPPGADVTTQPYPKEEDTELVGLSGSHSVQNMVNRFLGMASPTGTGGGSTTVTSQQETADSFPVDSTDGMRRRFLCRRITPNLNRTGSLNNKKKSERPARRAKSDVDVDPDTFKEINQSASSSASSLSNRSIESPGNSTDNVSDLLRAQYDDPDMDLEPELPPLKQVLSEDVLRKLKPKEKKRQEVINELFYTERAHLRNLKVLDLLFNRPMFQEKGIMAELARALFPNMEEMISLHVTFVRDIKDRTQSTPVVKEVGDLLLKRFDGDAGERFRKGCAEYCRNQAFALDALKKQTRKEPKLQQFLHDAESNSLCRRLQLKDLVPSQMQRLTKYPLLIDNLLKYTLSQSEEYRRIERALERCKHILAYVNQAVKECENYHKLKDIQKKLDRRPLEGLNDPAVAELKSLDLTQHKLIFDSPLTWKLRSHRTVDLHVLLFDDLLVLLQKQDEKYVLKCQNTNVQSARDDKYTHFPVLKLQNLLARTLATEKRSFFVVNISESRAQMYEFTAVSSELRLKWCKLINDKADEFKRSSSNLSQQAPRNTHPRIPQNNSSHPSQPSGPPLEEIYEVTDKLSRRLDIGDDQHSEGELILPEEVHISDAVTTKNSDVNSPQDILHGNWLQLDDAFCERDQLLTNLLNQSCAKTAKLDDTQMTGSREEDEEVEDDEKSAEFLVVKAMGINNRFISLITDSCPQQQHQQQQQQHLQQERPADLSNLPAPSRPLSTLSPVVSCQQTQPPPQLQQQPSLSSPVPMEQLKTMAAEMNAILSKLAGAINSGQEEKQMLRQELERAQLSLDSLKQMKKQMTESGTSPSDKTSVQLLSDIPLTAFSSSADTADSTTTISSSSQRPDADFVSPEESHLPLDLSRPETDMLKEKYGLVSIIQDVESLTSSLTETDRPSGSSLEASTVDLRIKEATVTQLEESVEHLSFCGEVPSELDPVVATETRTTEAGQMVYMAEDYDDDSNEVSVADLPLPDPVSICGDELVSLAQRQRDVDVDDSEVESDDCDTLNSKAHCHQDLAGATTTLEGVHGEMMETHATVSHQATSSSLHAEISTSAVDDDAACGDGHEISLKIDSMVSSSSVDADVVDRIGGGDTGAV